MGIDSFTPKEEMEKASRWVFGCVAALLMLGLVMVYSAKTVKSARLDGAPMAPLAAHALKVGIGLVGMLLMMRFDYRALARHYGKILLVLFLALVAVMIPGLGAQLNGAKRWFLLAGTTIQPSEFAKLGLIIVTASLVVKAGKQIEQFFKGTLPSLAAAGAVCLLILMEPDFGTATMTGCLVFVLLVIAGVKIRHFALLSLVLVPLLFLYAFFCMDHVEARVHKFLDRPEGGQVDFSLMAIASGGSLGKGLGASHLKLNFLPECESDFIFAVIGEETGFLGTSLVVLLYMAILWQGSKILLGIRNRFGFIMASGILIMIAAQALVNIAVVVGMAPTKGLPLPFISSGGSSLIALLMGVGLFLNIARNPDLPAERVCDAFFESKGQRLAQFLQPLLIGRKQ